VSLDAGTGSYHRETEYGAQSEIGLYQTEQLGKAAGNLDILSGTTYLAGTVSGRKIITNFLFIKH
jgi:hypothetical protein